MSRRAPVKFGGLRTPPTAGATVSTAPPASQPKNDPVRFGAKTAAAVPVGFVAAATTAAEESSAK